MAEVIKFSIKKSEVATFYQQITILLSNLGF